MSAKHYSFDSPLTRRQLMLGVGGLAALSGCTGAGAPAAGLIGPDGREVLAAEQAPDRGQRQSRPLRAAGGADHAALWWYDGEHVAYGDQLPGPLLRATAGDILEVAVANDLPQETTVHWHGLALRNGMDGVPGLTQDPIPAGAAKTYRFALAHPGTYWFHPHVESSSTVGCTRR